MRVANSCVRFHLRFLFFLFPDRSFPCRLDPIFRNLALRIPANRVNNKSLTYLGIVQCTEPGGLRIPMNSSKNREFWHMHRNYMCRNSGSLSEVSSLQLSEGEYQRSDRKTLMRHNRYGLPGLQRTLPWTHSKSSLNYPKNQTRDDQPL